MGLAAIGYDMVIMKPFQKFHLRNLLYQIQTRTKKFAHL